MGIPHGTPSGYSWHKCRCDECVGAKRAKDREYYERNREARKAKAQEWAAANREKRIAQQRQYREANAEQIKARKRRYNQEHADENRARAAAWQQANPERASELKAQYRERHRAEIRARSLARYYQLMAENPEKVRAWRRNWAKTKKGILANRAARSARRGAAYTAEALEWIAKLEDPLCIYCGRFATEIDHLVPITRGGTGELSNLATACRRCNARKNDMTYEEFLKIGVGGGRDSCPLPPSRLEGDSDGET